jgi:hypothetical protein
MRFQLALEDISVDVDNLIEMLIILKYATITQIGQEPEKRTTLDGQTVYRVKVRRKGAPLQTATFSKRSEARKWAQVTEGAVLEGRYLRRFTEKSLLC